MLGGSFNPAHAGHRHLSEEALKRLGLDEVWWLVSPQNPLKPRAGMAPFAVRLAHARKVAGKGRIRVTGIEERFGSAFTSNTLERLRGWREFAFVYLIGADNLVQLPRWRHWLHIVGSVPIAVFDRAPYSDNAVRSAAATALELKRLPEERARELKDMTAPVWIYLHMRAHPASSSAIRADAETWWRA